MAMSLNRTPVSPLGYDRPDDVVRRALGIAGSPGLSRAPDQQETPLMWGAGHVFELRVPLRDIKPAIWRVVRVRSNVTLFKLHGILQTVMGWTDSHMHEFAVKDGSYGKVDPDFPRRQNEKKAVLSDVLRARGEHLVYVYDFGDGWEHELVLEQVLDADPGGKYPYVIGGERACPPEDCGGVPGHTHLLDVLARPGHREHRDLVEWVGGSFDPEAFDAGEINARFTEAGTCRSQPRRRAARRPCQGRACSSSRRRTGGDRRLRGHAGRRVFHRRIIRGENQ